MIARYQQHGGGAAPGPASSRRLPAADYTPGRQPGPQQASPPRSKAAAGSGRRHGAAPLEDQILESAQLRQSPGSGGVDEKVMARVQVTVTQRCMVVMQSVAALGMIAATEGST